MNKCSVTKDLQVITAESQYSSKIESRGSACDCSFCLPSKAFTSSKQQLQIKIEGDMQL